jgi:hypothetical protein
MGNGALAIGPKLPRPSSTLPRLRYTVVALIRRELGEVRTRFGATGRAEGDPILTSP